MPAPAVTADRIGSTPVPEKITWSVSAVVPAVSARTGRRPPVCRRSAGCTSSSGRYAAPRAQYREQGHHHLDGAFRSPGPPPFPVRFSAINSLCESVDLGIEFAEGQRSVAEDQAVASAFSAAVAASSSDTDSPAHRAHGRSVAVRPQRSATGPAGVENPSGEASAVSRVIRSSDSPSAVSSETMSERVSI